jgi:type III restriction enzyme
LLGACLRMPYARRRQQPEMGKAYAHIVSQGFARVADTLADRLVNNMGFEAYEAARPSLRRKAPFPPGRQGQAATCPAEAVIPLPVLPMAEIPEDLKSSIEIRPTTNGATAIVRGELTEAVEDFLLSAARPASSKKACEAIERERTRQAQLAPSARRIPFAPLPQLCLQWDGDWQPVEKRLCCPSWASLILFAEPLRLDGFAVRESGTAFEIDVEGGKVVYQAADSGQLHLNEVASHANDNDLVRWLDRECRQPDIGQAQLIKWLLAVVRHLIADRGISH